MEVRLVSRQDHHVGLWAYDAQDRRSHDLDMRLLDDPSRLLRRYSVSWHCTGPETAEFDKAGPRITVDLMQEHQRLHGDVLTGLRAPPEPPPSLRPLPHR